MKTHTTYKESKYVAKIPDANGFVAYTDEENKTWEFLIKRQIEVVQNRACEAYLKGIELLNFPKDRIPQCKEVSEVLMNLTGWSVKPVPTLIPDDEFFDLLANRKFPAATFIRNLAELDYLEEPDIFHEYFGHLPMLTDQLCADFMQHYGQMALKASKEVRSYLARLYWFTIEFGLIQTPQGIRIYGGGILSSKEETIFCLEDPRPIRKPFDVLDILRTPYEINKIQPVYFIIPDFETLYQLSESELLSNIRKAQELGEYPPDSTVQC